MFRGVTGAGRDLQSLNDVRRGQYPGHPSDEQIRIREELAQP
jgi:hypothetical protein